MRNSVIKKMLNKPLVIDPRLFNSALALQTSWEPCSEDGTSKLELFFDADGNIILSSTKNRAILHYSFITGGILLASIVGILKLINIVDIGFIAVFFSVFIKNTCHAVKIFV